MGLARPKEPRHEYDRVAAGMTMAQVHEIFDIEGVETGLGGDDGELRYYRTCTGRGVEQIEFKERDRVTTKNAHSSEDSNLRQSLPSPSA